MGAGVASQFDVAQFDVAQSDVAQSELAEFDIARSDVARSDVAVPRPAPAANDAHVWLVESALYQTNTRSISLSVPEMRRARLFHFERDRRDFVAAHALLRAALTWCVPDVGAHEWTFRSQPHGRPEISGPLTSPAPRFNLSHADGLVACVVADVDCGVDVEVCDRTVDVRALSRRCLTPREQAAFSAVPAAGRAERFAYHWTLKEAYAKARGLGMSLPFDRFGFDWPPGGGIELHLDQSLPDDRAQWQFVQHRATARHVVAVALRCGPNPRRRVLVHRRPPAPWGRAEAGAPPQVTDPLGEARLPDGPPPEDPLPGDPLPEGWWA